MTRFLNISLRGATALSRFALLIFIAKYLGPVDLAYFGIFTVTISFTIYLIGFDFSGYSSRELVKAPINLRGLIVRSHVILLLIMYLFFSIPVLTLILNEKWPSYLVFFFLPILALELVTQDSSRLLVALSKQASASLIIFIRHGSWVIFCISIMSLFEGVRHLSSVLLAWCIGGTLATYFAFNFLKKECPQVWETRVDWVWIRKGLYVSAGLLISTLSSRAILTLDRYLIESISGLNELAAYVLFFGICNTLMMISESAFLSFSLPTLLKHREERDNKKFTREIHVLFGSILIVSLLFSIVCIFILPYLLNFIDNPLYFESQFLFYWILSATVIYAISMVPHLALYTTGNDRHIVLSHLFALSCFIIFVFLGNEYFDSLAVVLGLNVSFSTMLVWKWLAYLKLVRIESDCEGVR